MKNMLDYILLSEYMWLLDDPDTHILKMPPDWLGGIHFIRGAFIRGLVIRRERMSQKYKKTIYRYSRLSLSRIQRDSLKHFEISALRHIRVERVRKTIN